MDVRTVFEVAETSRWTIRGLRFLFPRRNNRDTAALADAAATGSAIAATFVAVLVPHLLQFLLTLLPLTLLLLLLLLPLQHLLSLQQLLLLSLLLPLLALHMPLLQPMPLMQ